MTSGFTAGVTGKPSSKPSRSTIGGFWRSLQQQVADEFDRLLKR